MPGPRTNPFPKSTRTQVWEQLCLSLTTDPVLQSAVDTWQLWLGKEEDLLEPTDEDMPVLRMTPVSGQSGWLDESTHQFRWPLKLTLGVSGTDVRVMLDFWGAIEMALFTDNTVLELLYPFSVIQKTISSPSVEPKLWGDASGLMAEGVLTILMRITS
jgi:hypothetical protein